MEWKVTGVKEHTFYGFAKNRCDEIAITLGGTGISGSTFSSMVGSSDADTAAHITLTRPSSLTAGEVSTAITLTVEDANDNAAIADADPDQVDTPGKIQALLDGRVDPVHRSGHAGQ